MPAVTKTKRSKRREPWSKLAQRHGVSTRTLDRWVKDGIIPPPEYINTKKYGDPDAAPRLDPSKPKVPWRTEAAA